MQEAGRVERPSKASAYWLFASSILASLEAAAMLQRTQYVLIAGLVLVAFCAGLVVRGTVSSPTSAGGTVAEHSHEVEGAPKQWTCAMHPQIKLPKPGKCPICSMDLIPLEQGTEDGGERVLAISEAAKALADIQTSPVARKFVAAEIRMVGKVDYDETRLAYITAWVPGRLDRLYVDYTGVPVRKGEHLVYLYSPELYVAQAELINAVKAAEEVKRKALTDVQDSAAAAVVSAREKLQRWGLTPDQTREVERRGKPSDHMTIYAPIGGIVVHKNAVEGMYVQTGTRIYTIADLNHVWVKLDAYESDLMWIRYGQDVEFVAEAYPGRRFQGAIAFVHPVLEARTRTVKVRLNVDNADGRLKPGMFVRAVLRAQLTEDGQVMEPRFAGKWMCPMHPEVVKDDAGKCNTCEMPLVRAESLGFAELGKGSQPPLVVPASAPLITGERAVVYVQMPDKEKPTFEGREVMLGPRAGDYYIVRQGLREGERVVTNGNFKIDSALQIRAKPSMMSASAKPEEQTPPVAPERQEPTPQAFRDQLRAVLTAYLSVHKALAADNQAGAAAAGVALGNALDAVDMRRLTGTSHKEWMSAHRVLAKAAGHTATAKTVAAQREAFALLSESLAAVLKRFGHSSPKTVFVCRCPMAFNNRGASWLQASQDILNPYFGAAMLKCGEVVGRLD